MSIGGLAMRRRNFTIILGSAAAGLGIAATAVSAQDGKKRIAILGPNEEPRFSDLAGGLQVGLRDQGYTGAALDLIQLKVARGNLSGARVQIDEAVRRGVVLLFVIGSELARAAREASSAIPIVFITPGDPVAAGLVASLARPGGDTTAMTFEFPDLSAKRLEFLKELAPRVRNVLVLHDPRDVSSRQNLAVARVTAPKLEMMLVEREVRSEADVSQGLASLGDIDALLSIPGGVTTGHSAEIIRTANARRLPTFFHSHTARSVDALASYGASDANVARQAAKLVDKILKGAKAGELPVERPSKLELVINQKTAKMLGLTIPPSLLARADDVIE